MPSLADARDCLRRVFGHADFRGLQADVIAEALEGRRAARLATERANELTAGLDEPPARLVEEAAPATEDTEPPAGV